MFNFDYIAKEDIKEYNPNWLKIPDHPYRISTFGDSGFGKTNALHNLTNYESDIDKIYLCDKAPHEAKCQLLIKNRKCRIKVFKWFKSCYWVLKWYGWYL